LSRGARAATFVDDDRRAVALVRENIQRCGIENLCVIIAAKAARAFDTLPLAAAFERFDIVFLDPPYSPAESGGVDALLRIVAGVVARDGVVVVEHARRTAASAAAGGFIRTRTIESGDSALSFYERERPAAGPSVADAGADDDA